MIQANELRIGNLIRDKESRHIVEVLAIDKAPEDSSVYVRAFDFIGRYIFESELLEGWLTPIKITEKRLLNCGFVKGEYKETYTDYTFDGYRLINEGNKYEFLIYGSSVILSEIKYIHELQNIYFILSKKELDLDYRKL